MTRRRRYRVGAPERGRDVAPLAQATDEPADRDAPQPRRDVAVTAEAPRLLPDHDERVLDSVRHELSVVAPAGEPEREPAGVAFVECAEGPDVPFGDADQQRRVARRAFHTSTVAPRARKSFTRRESSAGCRRRVGGGAPTSTVGSRKQSGPVKHLPDADRPASPSNNSRESSGSRHASPDELCGVSVVVE